MSSTALTDVFDVIEPPESDDLVLDPSEREGAAYAAGMAAATRRISETLVTLNNMGVPHDAVITVMLGSPDFATLERSLYALEQTAWSVAEGCK